MKHLIVNKVSTSNNCNIFKRKYWYWEYQGFAEFDENSGFDMEAYYEHYHEDENFQLTSDYARSMEKVIQNLKGSGVFHLLEITTNFYAIRVQHNY